MLKLFFVVVVLYVVFGVVVVLDVDVVIKETFKVDLRLLEMEIEFRWGGCGWFGGVQSHFHVKKNMLMQKVICLNAD